jgi:hypothetical protein
MQLQLKILSAVVNSRVLRSGDDKGQTKYSVDLYAHSGDMVPSKFVISGLSSETEAQAVASKYPHNASVVVRYTPRDSVWLDQSEIQPASK